MESPSERLIAAAKRLESSSVGISLEAAGSMQVDDDVARDVIACLYDTDPAVIRWGLWFCSAFLSTRKLVGPAREALLIQLPLFVRLAYVLRDEALAKIETLIGRKFDGARKSLQISDMKLVTWRDWQPFLSFWNAPWRRAIRQLVHWH